MLASVPSPSRFRNFAPLPNLPPLTQWHLLEAAFKGICGVGPAAFAPALGAMAAYVLVGQTWFLAWMMGSLAAIVLGQRVAAAFELRTSDSLPATWARRHAVTAWCQAAAVGAGGFGATLSNDPQTCLLVAFPLGFAIVQAGVTATLADSVRGSILLLTGPLVATCLFSHTPLFAVIAGLFALQAVAAFSMADGAIGRAQALAQSESSRMHAPLAGATLAPSATDFQRLLGRDQSTGLPNRHSFLHLVAQESARAVGAETQLSLLLISWDDYETYRNDNLPAVVEEALGRVARRLRATLHRPADILASLGAGRFGVLLAFTDSFGAATVARNLQTALCAPGPDSEATAELPIDALSIGCATHSGKGPLPETQLMRFAEEALENARRAGHNNIRRYDPTMTTTPPPPYRGIQSKEDATLAVPRGTVTAKADAGNGSQFDRRDSASNGMAGAEESIGSQLGN